MKFKKGDKVKVWSLQSFFKGGFLNGEQAEVQLDQKGDSVCLKVVRKDDTGEYFTDYSYEVYAKQCELIEEPKKMEKEVWCSHMKDGYGNGIMYQGSLTNVVEVNFCPICGTPRPTPKSKVERLAELMFIAYRKAFGVDNPNWENAGDTQKIGYLVEAQAAIDFLEKEGGNGK